MGDTNKDNGIEGSKSMSNFSKYMAIITEVNELFTEATKKLKDPPKIDEDLYDSDWIDYDDQC